MRNRLRPIVLSTVLVAIPTASSWVHADNWQAYLTVDNQFDVYFGTPMATNFYAGGGSSWPTEYSYTATGRLPTDYLYVSTASDHSVLQGFIGTFTNTTTAQTISTGNVVWEVFPAGKYAALIDPSWPNPWTPSLMPTQAQVDAAIAYATTNGLWVAPTTNAGYDNDLSTPISPYWLDWGTSFPNIQSSASWIWYDSGNDTTAFASPAPLNGFNHDEFLVFRVAGAVPEPSSALPAALLGGLALMRRRHTRARSCETRRELL